MKTKTITFKKLTKKLKSYNNKNFLQNKAFLSMPNKELNSIKNIYSCDDYCIDFENSTINLFYSEKH